jgi:hypothetical protein
MVCMCAAVDGCSMIVLDISPPRTQNAFLSQTIAWENGHGVIYTMLAAQKSVFENDTLDT